MTFQFFYVYINIILYVLVLALSLLILYNSNKGFFGVKAKNFLSYNNFLEGFLMLLMVFSTIILLINLLYVLITFLNLNSAIYLNVGGENNQDPIRWWPSGAPQAWSVIASAVAVYRTVPGSQRVKAAAGLGALGLSIPTVVWFHAVENPNGFNRLMYSMVEYKKSGVWPANVPNQVEDRHLDVAIEKVKEEAIEKTSGNNLIDLNIFKDLDLDKLINFFLQAFKPVSVEGYLDDLLGQQLFIYFLLLLIVISLIIFLFVYMFINIFLHNKEFILNKFNNKIIRFMVKYQVVLGKLSLYIIPLYMLFGLIELLVGIHYLITHPIGWEGLSIDLHTYISGNNVNLDSIPQIPSTKNNS